jgi:hypothetical protein
MGLTERDIVTIRADALSLCVFTDSPTQQFVVERVDDSLATIRKVLPNGSLGRWSHDIIPMMLRKVENNAPAHDS